ncbi:FtsX-like permease family [uncultured Clostridium sp.]|nr:FtsX-like permease family [uncultured Clostridium sp.]
MFGLFKENKITLAVNNSAYNELSKTIGKDKFNITTITLKNFDNTKEIVSYIRNNSDIDLYSVNEFNPNDYGFINAIYFIGLFLALVFVISVGSIMYFKCISDASKDKRRFDILRRIGTNQKYINKAIYKQIGIFFMIPALVSITHSIVAGYAITDLFNQNSILLTSTTIVSFLAIYLIYYILTARKYISLTK